MADPVEMVRARNVAIFHVCAEATAMLFCRSEFCLLAVLLGIPSSSVVACCCKQRETYLAWGLIGAVVATLHVKAAVTEAASDNDDAFLYLAQIVMCLISLHVVFYGYKVNSLMGGPVLPLGAQQADQVEGTRIYPPTGLANAQASTPARS